MTAIALLPVPTRALRQCSSLTWRTMFCPLGSTSAAYREWHGSGMRDLRRATISTLSVQCVSVQKSSALDPKRSPVLSKIPLPTHENIYTIPNILTFSRLVAAPLVGYFLVHDQHAAALSLFVYAGLTDLVDGYIARRYNLQTVVGTIIDPMADKLLMTIGVACLAVNGSIPVWLAVIILGRDVGLALSAIYYRWISLPPPKTMARYWDFSLPSAEVKPTGISKVNTALQLLLVGSAIALPVVPEAVLDAWNLREGMTALQYLVAATTIWSGLSYVFSKDAVKILTKEEIQRRLTRSSATKKKSS
ncbi:cardiolipin synthase [Aspergillus clavatus NRRL 1]|uniref:Phosphatidyl synthase n=1 Tax=Aspergillus clavatus (strain ATCC 1007 / CBS 513.65 / DSM 816 / NCTC 3887 / NRRL 1 / QM 1276 / 107) TaxID=344612 RepID=A1CM83_ASPCL|nr:phosphatidyl synthase [Aspergillus clavatus NRRL 1]EAW08670.1 phosphatidyl synthase [Aspergillus clavatus NRRL 1]